MLSARRQQSGNLNSGEYFVLNLFFFDIKICTTKSCPTFGVHIIKPLFFINIAFLQLYILHKQYDDADEKPNKHCKGRSLGAPHQYGFGKQFAKDHIEHCAAGKTE